MIERFCKLLTALLLLAGFMLACAKTHGATPDELGRWGLPEGTPIYRGQYVTAYDGRARCPRWSIECLTVDDVQGPAVRRDKWKVEKSLPLPLQVTRGDYSSLDWAIGHSVPAADAGEQSAKDATFILGINTYPQNPQMNSGVWAHIEALCRPSQPGVKAWIFTAPVFSTKQGRVRIETTGQRELWVPHFLVKVCARVYPGEEKPKHVDCWIVPNSKPSEGAKPGEFECDLNTVRAETGLVVFEQLEAAK